MKVAILTSVMTIALIIWASLGLGRQEQAEADDANEPPNPVVAEYQREVEKLALPAVKLTPNPTAAFSLGGTRLGGSVWLADQAEWPTGADGRPLEFVAQINFADMPPLPDYPTKGLFQLFIGRDDLFGSDSDVPEQGNFKLVWHPEGAVGGRSVPPPPLVKYGTKGDDGFNYSPFDNDAARTGGVMLKAESMMMQPAPMTLPAQKLMETVGLDPLNDSVEALYDDFYENKDWANHHIGGHPVFTQYDFRSIPDTVHRKKRSGVDYTQYDRVLFRLTSDKYLLWGDAGEAVVMIKRNDLIAGDFSKAVWWWDCS